MSKNLARTSDMIRAAVVALENDDRQLAQSYLQQAIQIEPENEEAWLWAAKAAETLAERVYCYNQVIKLNPYHDGAYENLRVLQNSIGGPINQSQTVSANTISPNRPHFLPEHTDIYTDEDEEFRELVISKMKARLGEPEIVRYVSVQYGLSWSDAKERVHNVWKHNIQYIETATNWWIVISCILGLILSFILIITAHINAPYILFRSRLLITILGLLMFGSSIGPIIRMWLIKERKRNIQ